jgi:hypothetical protein
VGWTTKQAREGCMRALHAFLSAGAANWLLGRRFLGETRKRGFQQGMWSTTVQVELFMNEMCDSRTDLLWVHRPLPVANCHASSFPPLSSS